MTSSAADGTERGPLAGSGVRRGKNVRGLRTRRLLLDAALGCFAEYGYGRTRISDVVFRAGISQGNFYRHFASKDEILLEASRPSLDELAATHPAPGEGADRRAIVARTSAYLTTYARHRRILRVMREAAATDPEEGFGALWSRQHAGFVERTAQWLRAYHGAEPIAGTDVELFADVLASALEQTAYVHIGLAPETPRRERIEELARAVGEVWFRSLPPV